MSLGDPIGWTDLPYLGGWQHFDPTGISWNKGQYMKDAAGFVAVRGLVKTSVPYSYSAASAQIFQLPLGYRPAPLSEMFGQMGEDSIPNCYFSRLDIYATGTANPAGVGVIEAGTGTNNGVSGFYTLSGIRFYAGF